MRNSVYEIAHCCVDVGRPRLFTCIVGTKGDTQQFYCHVFKCDSKETASKITRAVAQACTSAVDVADTALIDMVRASQRGQIGNYVQLLRQLDDGTLSLLLDDFVEELSRFVVSAAARILAASREDAEADLPEALQAHIADATLEAFLQHCLVEE